MRELARRTLPSKGIGTVGESRLRLSWSPSRRVAYERREFRTRDSLIRIVSD